MNLSKLFIERPVATTLLTLGITLLGILAFLMLPVAPLPQVDFPVISVRASLPGASPETMAATVAAPLERALGAIAGVNEMTSSSSLGATRVTLQFDLNRDIDGAARDVQAALNAARSLLPSGMPSNPTYRKVNPSDAPIMMLSMTSASMTRGQMFDVASTFLAQKLSQIDGIGEATVGGGALPAVRVELNPQALSNAGIGVEELRTAIVASNANRPKGALENDDLHWQIAANDQAKDANTYADLIVAWKNGAELRLKDIAEVKESVQDVRNAGLVNGKPAVLLFLYRQPGANIIATVERIKKILPQLQASIPAAIDLNVTMDRSTTIRASLAEVERTLLIAVALVVMVVFLFLRSWRAALIPSVAVPVSLIGTFAVMYLCGFSLNNLSLMALTVATGFVVDDAVVMLENISRHIEDGMPPQQAALQGAREVGFTVISMSLSLIAVFIPVLLMEGIVGRLFREFAVTLSAAILISLIISLSTTPMMCARILRPQKQQKHGRIYQTSERFFNALHSGYRRSLDWALARPRTIMSLLLITIMANGVLYYYIPKGFFPQQDTGRIMGFIQGDQSISFQAMREKISTFARIVGEDPAVENVGAFTGGGQRNSGSMFISLKPLSERTETADQIVNRLRSKLAQEPGAKLFMQAAQDIRVGGRGGNAQYQYTIQADSIDELRSFEPRIRQALSGLKELADVNTDQQDKGLQTSLVVDRDALARLGLTQKQVDATLNDLFGQRPVSTIYNPLNQYRVILEAAPQYLQSPETLKEIYVHASNGQAVPLAAFARWEMTATPLAVNHQGQLAASTISFNLPEGVSLSQATQAINAATQKMSLPASVQGSFQGTAKTYQASQNSQVFLIFAALIAVYLVLGILYESLIHPLTIISTLPSAGVGALLALMAFDTGFTIIALIGVVLLIGIVKKNAIMMIDFALDAERKKGLSSKEAIYEACLLRFRPIMMTTLAALFGALPLALGSGDGAELRTPLGIAIVGGLILSQALTLYTTPVVYLYLDRFRLWIQAWRWAGQNAGQKIEEAEV